MTDNLYFIANSGCDATTYGIARISDKDFLKFKAIIENLNKNSYYGCMPTIFEDNPDASYGDNDYVELENIFYLDGKTYTFAEEYFNYTELEQVL